MMIEQIERPKLDQITMAIQKLLLFKLLRGFVGEMHDDTGIGNR